MASHPRFRQKHDVNAFITNKLNNFSTFISWSNWLFIENAHKKACVLFLCIDVNEVTFLYVTHARRVSEASLMISSGVMEMAHALGFSKLHSEE